MIWNVNISFVIFKTIQHVKELIPYNFEIELCTNENLGIQQNKYNDDVLD